MEPCGSSPVWQQSITCSYPKPDQSIPPPSYFLTIHFSITIPSTPRSYKLHLSITFPYGKLYAPLLSLTRATCPSHLAILDLIILTIFGEAYTSVGLNGSLGTGWTIRGWKPGGGEIFRTRSDRPCGPISPLHNEFQVIPGGKEPRLKKE